MNSTQYLYGTDIGNLRTTEDKVHYGYVLILRLVSEPIKDKARLQDVTERFIHNCKVLQGGI